MNLKQADARVGGLSNPSKMPCFGTSIPARACRLGALLAQQKGTTCSGCYALKGMYGFPAVQAALEHRLALVVEACASPEAHVEWVDAMAYLLNTRAAAQKRGRNDPAYFRWFDSGDLQSLQHLELIVDVAMLTPDVEHWLPTRELPTVIAWMASNGAFPPNLTVRLSANVVGAAPPKVEGCSGSGVHTIKGEPVAGAVECEAYKNDNACGDCRKCWEVPSVSYLKH